MLRESGAAVVIVALGAWATGVLGGGYSRTVDKPPAEVAAAIADLDIRNAPGSPGTDPLASGGQVPTFRVEAAPDHVSYVVMAHGQVAMTMTAWLKSVDGGKRTKVTASVQRGPAPDDYVSPAFRSNGITMGLFAAELEGEIDKLVFPPGQWTAQCDAIVARFEGGNEAQGFDRSPGSLTQAIGNTAKMSMRLGQFDKELKTAHCPQPDNKFHDVHAKLSDAGPPAEPPPMVRPEDPSSPADSARPTMDLGKYR